MQCLSLVALLRHYCYGIGPEQKVFEYRLPNFEICLIWVATTHTFTTQAMHKVAGLVDFIKQLQI